MRKGFEAGREFAYIAARREVTRETSSRLRSVLRRSTAAAWTIAGAADLLRRRSSLVQTQSHMNDILLSH